MRTPLLPQPYQRLVLYLLLAVLAVPASGALAGMLGLSGQAGAAWFGVALSLALLGATVLVARLGGERLAVLGFVLTRHQLRLALAAFAIGVSAMVLALLVLGAAGGNWERNPATPWMTAVAGVLPVLSLFLGEELLFRGYAFQQLRRVVGTPAAVTLSAAAFGAYHLLGSGDWAMGAVFRFTMPALAGVVFALALLRTGSIAVPIGMHWGVNWVQAFVLGLGQSPGANSAAWVMPLAPEQAQALSAPDLLPHVPYLAALGLMMVFVLRYPRRLEPIS